MINRTIQRADHYLALTDYDAQFVIKNGAIADRVSVVGVGVDPIPFQEVPTQEAKLRFGLRNQVVIGYIGQLVEHKGIDILLQAMPLVWKQVPNVSLLVAGSHTRYVRKLQEIISTWPPEYRDNITLLFNFLDEDKASLYAALDIFVYPSAYESFGIAYLEARAAEKPLIGCRRGAIPSVISTGQDGLLIDRRDANTLAEAILTLVENPALGRQMGEAGRRKVMAHYTWPEVARRYRQAYQLALGNL